MVSPQGRVPGERRWRRIEQQRIVERSHQRVDILDRDAAIPVRRLDGRPQIICRMDTVEQRHQIEDVRRHTDPFLRDALGISKVDRALTVNVDGKGVDIPQAWKGFQTDTGILIRVSDRDKSADGGSDRTVRGKCCKENRPSLLSVKSKWPESGLWPGDLGHPDADLIEKDQR